MFVYQLNLFGTNTESCEAVMTTTYYTNLKKVYGAYKSILEQAQQPCISYGYLWQHIDRDGRYFSNFSFQASVSIIKHTVL
jgi:hypothetical protein